MKILEKNTYNCLLSCRKEEKNARVRAGCVITVFLGVVLPVNSNAAALFNPGFESYVYDSGLDCNVPTGWTGEHYTAVVQKFVPDPNVRF